METKALPQENLMKSVVLSTTETEYMALSEVVK